MVPEYCFNFLWESANPFWAWKASADLSIFPAWPVNSILQWRTFILVNQYIYWSMRLAFLLLFSKISGKPPLSIENIIP
jgi:hypothetical protein